MVDKNALNHLYRYSLSLTKKEDQAYDILQTCLEKYLSQNRSEVADVTAYLMRMIRHQFIDEQRRNQRYLVLVAQSANTLEGDHPPCLDDMYIQQRQIEQLTDLLSPDEGELLFLWAVEQYSTQEIADFLEVSKGTLLSRMHRLKKRLRAELDSGLVDSGRAQL